MRVVHISTFDLAGGAARAAFRLHKALLALGAQSTMLVRDKRSDLESVHSLAPEPDARSVFGGLIETWYIHRSRTPVSNTHFSLGWPGQDLSAHPSVRKADIIHLHWVSDFQSTTTLARLQGLGKPVVWTLHDQRPFTGGCHFSAGCRKYEATCAGCPQLAADPAALPAANLADQVRLGRSGASVVAAPSRWIAEAARRSAVFSRARIEVIPNGVETDCFQPWPQREARRRLGLPATGSYLLFGADSADEKRKGVEELVAALEGCLADAGFRQSLERGQLGLLCFGRVAPALSGRLAPIKSFGHIDSAEVLSTVYAAADLFVLPSIEDNLPNTVLESLSCGTPVVAFNTGGVPDLIVEGLTGELVPTGDCGRLGQSLRSLLADPSRLSAMRPACRRHVEENFSLDRQAARFRDLYLELLRQPSPLPASDPSTSPAAGSEFRRVFPTLLQHMVERFGAAKARTYHPVPGSESGWRRWWFLKQVRRSAILAASGRLSHETLMRRLGEELALCQAPFAQRVGRSLKRLLSSIP